MTKSYYGVFTPLCEALAEQTVDADMALEELAREALDTGTDTGKQEYDTLVMRVIKGQTSGYVAQQLNFGRSKARDIESKALDRILRHIQRTRPDLHAAYIHAWAERVGTLTRRWPGQRAVPASLSIRTAAAEKYLYSKHRGRSGDRDGGQP